MRALPAEAKAVRSPSQPSLLATIPCQQRAEAEGMTRGELGNLPGTILGKWGEEKIFVSLYVPVSVTKFPPLI